MSLTEVRNEANKEPVYVLPNEKELDKLFEEAKTKRVAAESFENIRSVLRIAVPVGLLVSLTPVNVLVSCIIIVIAFVILGIYEFRDSGMLEVLELEKVFEERLYASLLLSKPHRLTEDELNALKKYTCSLFSTFNTRAIHPGLPKTEWQKWFSDNLELYNEKAQNKITAERVNEVFSKVESEWISYDTYHYVLSAMVGRDDAIQKISDLNKQFLILTLKDIEKVVDALGVKKLSNDNILFSISPKLRQLSSHEFNRPIDKLTHFVNKHDLGIDNSRKESKRS